MDDFDPYNYQEPARVLVQHVRGLRVGQSVRLTDGTVIKSIAMRHGATHVRRFSVIKAANQRGEPFVTAEQAAGAALKGVK